MRSRAAALAVVALVGAVAVTGCAPLVCPAIGWVNGIAIETPSYPDADLIELCVGDVCTSGEDGAPLAVVGQGPGSWTVRIDMDLPSEVIVRVFDWSGDVLHESVESIDWTLDTSPCGGPARAEPIRL